jgi:hypothetical protein
MTERSLKIKPQKEIVKPNPNHLKEELAVSHVRDPYYTQGTIGLEILEDLPNVSMEHSVEKKPPDIDLSAGCLLRDLVHSNAICAAIIGLNDFLNHGYCLLYQSSTKRRKKE